MAQNFTEKSAARQWVWDRLAAEGVARFPFPPHGRIPNFAGAELAAARFLEIDELQIVGSVPRDSTDQPLNVIATPTHVIRIRLRGAAPRGIDWTRLGAEDLEEMPILGDLKRTMT